MNADDNETNFTTVHRTVIYQYQCEKVLPKGRESKVGEVRC